MGSLIGQMNSYAEFRLHSIDIKKLEGITPEDVVADVLLKVLEGKRNWTGAISFNAFLFGCVKSEISHIIARIEKKGERVWRIKDYLFGISDDE